MDRKITLGRGIAHAKGWSLGRTEHVRKWQVDCCGGLVGYMVRKLDIDLNRKSEQGKNSKGLEQSTRLLS